MGVLMGGFHAYSCSSEVAGNIVDILSRTGTLRVIGHRKDVRARSMEYDIASNDGVRVRLHVSIEPAHLPCGVMAHLFCFVGAVGSESQQLRDRIITLLSAPKC
jgi:hypothetical protein